MTLSPTVEYLNHNTPKMLATAVDAAPIGNNPMTGCYAVERKDSMRSKSVVVVGGGEVYQKMIGPALHHLGVKVYLFDPNPDILTNYGETRIENLEDAPRDIPAFILSPNKQHARQARFFIERGQPVAVEKPICLSEEVEELRDLIAKAKVPTYWIDFNHMMGRSLLALAGGVKMPFMDSAAVEIESDPTGKITESIRDGVPLIKGKVVKVTGRYFQAGNAPGGSVDHRAGVNDLRNGGGMLRDLMTRLFNMSQLAGLSDACVNDVDLRVADRDKPGNYIPVTAHEETEHYAAVKGTMRNGTSEAAYDFAVGKYAASNDLQLTLEYDTGDKLTLEWLPPNRKNRVTWRNAEGDTRGQVFSRVDPYMLIALDALSHLETKEPVALYFPEQLKSVEVLRDAAIKGRQHLDRPKLTQVG